MSEHEKLPALYRSKLSLLETEDAIKLIKDVFERELADGLNLIRVSAPLFVRPETGLNDNLSGIERPVSFDIPSLHNANGEIVQSLAKWKRNALYRYKIPQGKGLYTDMDAIRRDEEPDRTHSVYVDQWDWEKVISESQRTLDTLKTAAELIMESMRVTELALIEKYPVFGRKVPEKLFCISSQELEDLYP
ncbi:MAG: aspartate--ammonia ligase, partial [Oscillospiraceae bacterium]